MPDLSRDNPTGFVTKGAAGANETQSVEPEGFSPWTGPDPPAQVSVSLGVTVNLQNYESARLDVGLRIPCSPTEISVIFDRAKQWCEGALKKEIQKMKRPAR